jgi:hypothetical protein
VDTSPKGLVSTPSFFVVPNASGLIDAGYALEYLLAMFVGSLGTHSLLRKEVCIHGRIVCLSCGRYDYIGVDCGVRCRATVPTKARKGETAALATVSRFY